jgi:Flp pilus assembly protein TadB
MGGKGGDPVGEGERRQRRRALRLPVQRREAAHRLEPGVGDTAGSMRANVLRVYLIGALAVAAVISVIGNKAHSPFIGWVSFAVFLSALVLYLSWRRAALRERRGRVFDREAKTTDETGTRSDQ